MRRTHANLSRKAGINSKLVADQLGHGIGVNIDTYGGGIGPETSGRSVAGIEHFRAIEIHRATFIVAGSSVQSNSTLHFTVDATIRELMRVSVTAGALQAGNRHGRVLPFEMSARPVIFPVLELPIGRYR